MTLAFRHILSIVLIVAGMLGCNGVCAQLNVDSLFNLGVCTQQGWAIPSVDGTPRAKGFELYQERAPNYTLQSQFGDTDSSFTNAVRRSKSLFMRLRLPIINRDDLKLIAGGKYFQEQFAFDNPELLNNEFHQNLQDKPFKSIGLEVNMIKSFVGNKYIAGRWTGRFNGDFSPTLTRAHFKTSLLFLYGIKVHANKSWGFGASYSNTFGVSSLYPLLFYQNRFREKWLFQTRLPLSASLTYMPNEKNVLYFISKLEGDKYNLNFESLPETPLFLELSDFKAYFNYEREIYDFFWVHASAGLRYNLNFDLSNTDLFFEQPLLPVNPNNTYVSNDLSAGFFFRFGIFIVPPRKWMQP